MSTIFNYNNANITFKTDNGEVFVNATEMAKAFGKRPNDYFNLQATKELISALQTITSKNGNDDYQIVITERGGTNPCTWMHEDIALDFAQWLSVDFKIWCNNHIKQLIKQGYTTNNISNEQLLELIANKLQLTNIQTPTMPQLKAIELQQPQFNLTGWQWEDCPNIETVFKYLLTKAKQTTTMHRNIVLKRGEAMFTLSQVAAKCGLSVTSVRSALKNLTKSDEIITDGTSKYTLVRVLKYDEYLIK